jgi:cytochrome c-type biogenesis protein CcmE
MAYVGGSADWQYYLTVDECAARGQSLLGSRIRVNGNVAPGTLHVDTDRTQASFQLLGAAGNLPAHCGGPIPDNLAENMAVVVEGRLDDHGVLQGSKLLTRCASKYETLAARSGTGIASGTQPAAATPGGTGFASGAGSANGVQTQTAAHATETVR